MQKPLNKSKKNNSHAPPTRTVKKVKKIISSSKKTKGANKHIIEGLNNLNSNVDMMTENLKNSLVKMEESIRHLDPAVQKEIKELNQEAIGIISTGDFSKVQEIIAKGSNLTAKYASKNNK